MVQRARSLEAIRQIQRGEVTFPLCCGHCMSTSVVQERRAAREGAGVVHYRTVLACLSCSRETTLQTAHLIRRQQMKAFIREGVDIDLTRSA